MKTSLRFFLVAVVHKSKITLIGGGYLVGKAWWGWNCGRKLYEKFGLRPNYFCWQGWLVGS